MEIKEVKEALAEIEARSSKIKEYL